MKSDTYWNNNGKYEDTFVELYSLIPESGPVEHPRKNPALEKFRKASNCYYDLYNNGLINCAGEFRTVFGIPSSHFKIDYGPYRAFRFSDDLYELVEKKMDEIILAAFEEQKAKFAKK